MKKPKRAKHLWSGRFKKEMHPVFKCFSYSLNVDYELLEAELLIDRAWVKMLAKTGLISASEARTLLQGLDAVEKKLGVMMRNGVPQALLAKYEDIHTLIQTLLEESAGPIGKKIHTGRSRNDLVVTSTRIYLRNKITRIQQGIREVQKALTGLARKSGDLVIPGMTHWRKAQPLCVAHHLLAYVEMLQEDFERLTDARKRVNVMGLGSAALAGSSLALDQKLLCRELGFDGVSANSLTAVSDRAFISEVLGALAIMWMHFSRFSEDIILWNSEYLGFIELDDAFASGSSLMPQKKNPDIFELLRGRSGVLLGQWVSMMAVQKGLPLAYNRDLQEDKPGLMDAVKKTELALELLALTVSSISFNPKAAQRALKDDGLYATDLLEYLVRKGAAFSDAHETIGRIVRKAAETDRAVRDLSVQEFKQFSDLFDRDVFKLFDAAESVSAKKTIGSTNPARVASEIRKWETVLKG